MTNIRNSRGSPATINQRNTLIQGVQTELIDLTTIVEELERNWKSDINKNSTNKLKVRKWKECKLAILA